MIIYISGWWKNQPSVGKGQTPPHFLGHHITCLQSIGLSIGGSHNRQRHVKWYVSVSKLCRRLRGRVVSIYAVKIYIFKKRCVLILKWNVKTGNKKKTQTSSSGAIYLKATTCIRGSLSFFDSPPARGNTTTAFGSHEWLIKATTGETHAPIGVKAGVDTVNVLVVNL